MKDNVEGYRKEGSKHEFRDYAKEKFTQVQEQYQLTPKEKLIWKPHKKGASITDLTKEELDEYLALDIEELKRQEVKGQVIRTCKVTQDYIRNNYDKIIKLIQKKQLQEKDSGDDEQER